MAPSVFEQVSLRSGMHDRARGTPQVRLIENPTKRGLSAACNQGARASDAPWILFLNPDAEARSTGAGSFSREISRASTSAESAIANAGEVCAYQPRAESQGRRTAATPPGRSSHGLWPASSMTLTSPPGIALARSSMAKGGRGS